MDEPQKTAVAFFNYAHSYAQSAVTLQEHKTEATHWNAPVYFLFFHAIELYLKAYLIMHGFTEAQLRKKEYGHNTQVLADAAMERGLELSVEAKFAIGHMADTDNVITSRYIRLGTHTRLPLSAYFDACDYLHHTVGDEVYAGSGVTRRPMLRDVDEEDGP